MKALVVNLSMLVTVFGIIILPDAIHIMHKSVKPEELDFTTADELLEAEMDAELEDKDE